MREANIMGEQVMSGRRFPSLFVSHGAPTLALEENETVEFLKQLGAQLGRPAAVLCVSAHWETRVPTVSAAARPETIHDFGGFPAELYRMRYPAPGAPELAARVASLLAEAGIESQMSPDRGLDHGAWIPLKLMYPEADVPVTQLSVQPHAGAAEHFRLGRALAPLRDEGVLILATGSATHNLARLGREGVAPLWAARFEEWLHQKVTSGAHEELLDYRRLAPDAQLAHPTDEHLLPLFVALGAGSGESATRGRSLHRGWTWG
ncbi:MAG TPA: class III extradiol ring-cleavage dioxygenase, partial [Pyrinomonadaceae bacterium]